MINVIFAPHYDDEILGCGGVISKLKGNGEEVIVVYCTSAKSEYSEYFNQKSVDQTLHESFLVCRDMGIESVHLDFPVPGLNAFPEFKISIAFVDILKKFRPDCVFLPFPGDLHQDHKAIYRAGLVAVRPKNGILVKRVLTYEVLSETDWGSIHEPHFYPNYFIPISKENMRDKLEMMRYYNSQLGDGNSNRTLTSLEALARLRGGTIGEEYAEAFILEREIAL